MSANRLAATVEAIRADGTPARMFKRKTASRLLVGMGYKNALEVGLTFHHPGGFPYLPGTGVKGLTRAWAEGVEEADPEVVQRIFGSKTKRVADASGEMVAGSVAFLDALPTVFPRLDVDLLNPHVGDYYMDDTGKVPPAEWFSPVPVPFLAVAAGQTFRFALVGRPADSSIKARSAAEADVETATEWLNSALTDLGAGGKTAAGYGFFGSLNVPSPVQPAPDVTRAVTTQKTNEPEKWSRVSKNSTDVPARVVRVEGSAVVVLLHVDGYDEPFMVQARGLASDFKPDDWLTVSVAGISRKGLVNALHKPRKS